MFLPYDVWYLLYKFSIKDLEYFGKKLFDKNFVKEDWNLYSGFQIIDKLKENNVEHINDNGFKFLEYFLSQSFYSYNK